MQMLHVTIQTNKFAEEMEFYEKYTGIVLQRDLRPIGMPIVFLSDNPDDTKIEIIENPEGEDCHNAYVSVGFKCEDVIAKYDEMKSAGFEVTDMIVTPTGARYFFVKDPAGVMVQFI